MKKIPSLSRIKTQIKLIRVIDFFVTVIAIVASIWLWWFEPEPKTEFWTNFFQNNIWKYVVLLVSIFILLPAYALLTYILKYNVKTKRDAYCGNDKEWRLIKWGPLSFFVPRNISLLETIDDLWEKIPFTGFRQKSF